MAVDSHVKFAKREISRVAFDCDLNCFYSIICQSKNISQQEFYCILQCVELCESKRSILFARYGILGQLLCQTWQQVFSTCLLGRVEFESIVEKMTNQTWKTLAVGTVQQMSNYCIYCTNHFEPSIYKEMLEWYRKDHTKSTVSSSKVQR